MEERGFSLLEFIVVLGIISVVLFVTLASFNRFNQQKTLEAEAEKIVDVLALAKNKTISGDSSMCSPPLAPAGFSVSIQLNGTYILAPTDCSPGSPLPRSYSVNSVITVLNASTITFSNQGLSASGNGIKIRNRIWDCRCIKSSPNGGISEDKLINCGVAC